mgnify:CR=1 FL=1
MVTFLASGMTSTVASGMTSTVASAITSRLTHSAMSLLSGRSGNNKFYVPRFARDIKLVVPAPPRQQCPIIYRAVKTIKVWKKYSIKHFFQQIFVVLSQMVPHYLLYSHQNVPLFCKLALITSFQKKGKLFPRKVFSNPFVTHDNNPTVITDLSKSFCQFNKCVILLFLQFS